MSEVESQGNFKYDAKPPNDSWSMLGSQRAPKRVHSQTITARHSGSPAHFRCFADALIVCVDCEGWQSNANFRTSEIGVTVLDTRDLVGKAIKDWDKDFNSFHYQ